MINSCLTASFTSDFEIGQIEMVWSYNDYITSSGPKNWWIKSFILNAISHWNRLKSMRQRKSVLPRHIFAAISWCVHIFNHWFKMLNSWCTAPRSGKRKYIQRFHESRLAIQFPASSYMRPISESEELGKLFRLMSVRNPQFAKPFAIKMKRAAPFVLNIKQ